MFSKTELLASIKELEDAPKTFQNMQKLSTFYSLFDHLYSRSSDAEGRQETVYETKIDYYGDSDFLLAIENKEAERVWLIIDELMQTVKVLQPRLYDATMQEIKEVL